MKPPRLPSSSQGVQVEQEGCKAAALGNVLSHPKGPLPACTMAHSTLDILPGTGFSLWVSLSTWKGRSPSYSHPPLVCVSSNPQCDPKPCVRQDSHVHKPQAAGWPQAEHRHLTPQNTSLTPASTQPPQVSQGTGEPLSNQSQDVHPPSHHLCLGEPKPAHGHSKSGLPPDAHMYPNVELLFPGGRVPLSKPSPLKKQSWGCHCPPRGRGPSPPNLLPLCRWWSEGWRETPSAPRGC